MTIESASYISQLDTTLPTAADLISEGDDHLRLIKTALKTQFPNFGTTAITASAAEVNYSVGVTSAIQTQLNGKGAINGQAWTGAHSFAGDTSVPTLAAGTNTTGAASTAFVQADFLQKFPNYTAPVNASTTELNYLVGLTGAIQPQLSNQVAGPIHAATAKTTPVDADELGIADSAASWALKKLTFANLKSWIGGLFVSKSGDTMTGALNLPSAGLNVGSGELITYNNRVGVGTATPDSFVAKTLQINGASSSLRLTDAATGIAKERGLEVFTSGGNAGILQRENSYLTLGTNSLERMRIDANGHVLVTGGGTLGYGAGAGGTATQPTSNTSDVTLNKQNGVITLANGSIAGGGRITFQLQNSLINVNSIVVVHGLFDGSSTAIAQFTIQSEYVQSGYAIVSIKNNNAAAVNTDNVKFRFAVFAGSSS